MSWINSMTIGDMRALVSATAEFATKRTGSEVESCTYGTHVLEGDDYIYLNMRDRLLSSQFIRLKESENEQQFRDHVHAAIMRYPSVKEVTTRKIMEAVEALKEASTKIDNDKAEKLDSLIAAILGDVAEPLLEDKRENENA